MDKRKIIIRPIEEQDKGNYLNLFQKETFGCVGINSDMKPSLIEEESFLTRVINKETISEYVLIMEAQDNFIGYATIDRHSEKEYHIGQFVIIPEKRKQGYGSYLLETIKDYAKTDGCNISLECISNAQSFFLVHGFNNKGLHFKYEIPSSEITTIHSPIYVDYQLILSEQQNETKKQMQKYKEFLRSDLCKNLFDML